MKVSPCNPLVRERARDVKHPPPRLQKPGFAYKKPVAICPEPAIKAWNSPHHFLGDRKNTGKGTKQATIGFTRTEFCIIIRADGRMGGSLYRKLPSFHAEAAGYLSCRWRAIDVVGR
jgi:hypothetical protein